MVEERSLDPRNANSVTAVIKCKATRILPRYKRNACTRGHWVEQKKAHRGGRYEISDSSNKSRREHAGVSDGRKKKSLIRTMLSRRNIHRPEIAGMDGETKSPRRSVHFANGTPRQRSRELIPPSR